MLKRLPYPLMVAASIGAFTACGVPGEATPPLSQACDPTALSFTYESLVPPESLPYSLAEVGENVSGFGVAVGDLTGDGAPEILWVHPIGSSFVFLNNGRGGMSLTDGITLEGAPIPPATSVAMADVDGDGDLDVFLGSTVNAPDRLLYNQGDGTFTLRILRDETPNDAITNTGTFADIDGDGDLDIYAAHTLQNILLDTSGEWDTSLATDSVYINEGGTFTEEAERIQEGLHGALCFESVFFDHDDDGDLDQLLLHDFGMYITPNRLALNDGDGYFELIEGTGADQAMFAMGAARGDVNDDGAMDFFITNISAPSLLMGDGVGGYYDGTRAMGVYIPPEEERLVSWGTGFVDINQDTYLDLGVVYGTLSGDVSELEDYAASQGESWVDSYTQQDSFFLGTGDGNFEEVSDSSGFNHDGVGRAFVLGDLDLDGSPEIITAGKEFVRVWRPEAACGGGITLKFGPNPKNVHGIGAKVEVDAGGRSFTRWHLPGATFSSSVPDELYIGVGEAETVDLRVTWLGGEVQTLEAVPVGARLVITP